MTELERDLIMERFHSMDDKLDRLVETVKSESELKDLVRNQMCCDIIPKLDAIAAQLKSEAELKELTRTEVSQIVPELVTKEASKPNNKVAAILASISLIAVAISEWLRS